jgi:cyanate permease
MAIISSLGLGMSLLMISNCDRIVQVLSGSVGQEYLIYVMITVPMLCFLLIRFFGQGNLTMIGRVAMGKWFNHRRGVATAISGVFVTFAFSGAPLFLNYLIEAFGWRGAYMVLAGGVGIIMSIIAWIFYRDNPEQCGLVMDGVTDEGWLRKQAEKAPEIRKEFTCKEAVRTLTFWAFTLGLAIFALVITAVTFNLTSLGEEMGRSRAATLAVFWPMSCIGICTRFGSSWLSDRTAIRLKWHLVVMMIAEIIGAVGLLFFGSGFGWAMMAIGYGVTGGLMGALLNIAWPRFFGREHLGAISGLAMSILVWASAIGPWLFSLGHNITGDYRAAICVCAFLPIAIIIAALKAENPQEAG